jgi:hypothetical protein
LLNNTRYAKAARQTVYLANSGIKNFDKDGFIMGNNVNKFNPKPENKFPGVIKHCMYRNMHVLRVNCWQSLKLRVPQRDLKRCA